MAQWPDMDFDSLKGNPILIRAMISILASESPAQARYARRISCPLVDVLAFLTVPSDHIITSPTASMDHVRFAYMALSQGLRTSSRCPPRPPFLARGSASTSCDILNTP